MDSLTREPSRALRQDSRNDCLSSAISDAEKGQSSAEDVKGESKETNAETEADVEPPSSAPPGPPGPVDHGLMAWFQVVGTFAIWTNAWGLINAYGVFQTYYEVGLLAHNTPSQISWVGSIQGFLLLFVGVLSGPVHDAGYFKHLCIFGNFMIVFGLMMTSICTEYWQILLAQGITCGIGFGCMFTPSIAIVPQYFVKKRAFAAGLAATGSGFGGVIYPIMLHRLLPIIGFGWTLRVIAFMSLFFAIIAVTTLRDKRPPGKMRRLINPDFIHNVPMVLFTVGGIFLMMGLYVPVYYIGSYSLQSGLASETLSFYMVPILQSAGIVSRIVLIYFADKYGPLNVNLLALSGAAIMAFAWIGIRNQAGLIIFALLYGTFFGVVLGITPTCAVALTTDMKTLGSSVGTVFGVTSVGVLIGTPISGVILGTPGDFLGVQAFVGGILALGAVFIACSRVAKVGMGLGKV